MPTPDHAEGSHQELTRSLAVRLRSGDPKAGALLEKLYRGPMTRFCWGYLESVEDAEDAVQDVLYKVLRAPEVPDNFRAWVYKIARNHCLNMVRDRARRQAGRVAMPDAQRDAALTGNLTRMVKQELRSRMMHLLGALPVAQREILRLRYAEGLSRPEIAYVLDAPEKLVKSRLFDGLKKLREHTSLLEGE